MSTKTKSVAIVTSSLISSGSLLLEQTCRELGYEPVMVLAQDPEAAHMITDADAVIYRRSPKKVADYEALYPKITHPEHKRQLLYSLEAFNKCDSYLLLDAAHVPMPKSEIITSVDEPPFLPGVLKAPVGNKGIGVSLVTTVEDYKNTVAELLEAEGQCLYQEYIEESKGTDTRIIVCGDRVVTSMKRIAKAGEFRANIHLGASAVAYEPTQQECQIAIDAVKALHLPYGGADIIDSANGPLVLEVNSSPGFAISKITGVDIAAKIIKQVVGEESS